MNKGFNTYQPHFLITDVYPRGGAYYKSADVSATPASTIGSLLDQQCKQTVKTTKTVTTTTPIIAAEPTKTVLFDNPTVEWLPKKYTAAKGWHTDYSTKVFTTAKFTAPLLIALSAAVIVGAARSNSSAGNYVVAGVRSPIVNANKQSTSGAEQSNSTGNMASNSTTKSSQRATQTTASSPAVTTDPITNMLTELGKGADDTEPVTTPTTDPVSDSVTPTDPTPTEPDPTPTDPSDPADPTEPTDPTDGQSQTQSSSSQGLVSGVIDTLLN